MNNFSNIIKEKRLAMKLSLRNASRLIGISHTYLNNLEKGFDHRTDIKNKPTPKHSNLLQLPMTWIIITCSNHVDILRKPLWNCQYTCRNY